MDINHKDKLGRTPLATAFFYNFTDIAKLLLDNHSKVESPTIDRALFGWNNHVQIESINLLQEYQWVNLYLDDLRDIPEGFMGVRTIEGVIGVFENYKVHILSLDHDLGMDEEGVLRNTGYDLVKWICERDLRPANKIYIHTDNVVGKENMYETLKAAQKRGYIDDDIEIYPYPIVRNRYSSDKN